MTEPINCLAPEIPADIETARAQLHACKEEIEAIHQETAPGQEGEVTERLEGIRSLLPVLGRLAQEKISALEKGRDKHKWAKIGGSISDVFTAINEVAPLFSNPDSFYAVKIIETAEVLDLQMRASRKEAYERLGRVIEGLQEETPPRDLEKVFDHYLEGEVNALNGCRTPDVLMAGDAELGGEIWKKSQLGEYACGQIVERNHRLDNIAVSLFQGKDEIRKDGVPPLYFGAYGSLSDMERFTDIPLESFYVFLEALGGYKFPLPPRGPKVFQGSGPLIEGAVSLVAGDERNLGSHRVQFALRGGWSQHFSPYIFLEPKVGLGFAINNLNFGRGFPLTTEYSLMFHGQASAGGSIPLNPTSALKIFGGFFYERTVTGEPGYYHYGPIVGAELAFQPLKKAESENERAPKK